MRLSLRLIVVTVGALAGFVQRRTALAAEFGYGCALRDLGLRVLRLCCLRTELLAQVAHVGGRENAVLLFVSVLAAELVVDGDYVFQQQDCHHQQFIHQSDHNGSEDHDQDAVDTQPVAIAKVVLRRGKEHEEAQNDHICREENVQSLQNFLYDQVLEIAGIMEEFAESIELFAAFFGDDKHIGQNCGDDSQNSADDGEYTELLDYITKNIHVVPLSFFAVMIR